MSSSRPICYQPRRWPERKLTASGVFVYAAPHASRGVDAVDLEAAIRVAEVEAVQRDASADAFVAEASRVAETRSADWASEGRFDALLVVMGAETHLLAQVSRPDAARALIAAGMPRLAEIVRDRHAGLRLRFLIAFDGDRVALLAATRPRKEWPVWRPRRESAAARRVRLIEAARQERASFEFRAHGRCLRGWPSNWEWPSATGGDRA